MLGLALAVMMHPPCGAAAFIRVSRAAALGDSDGRGGAAVALHVRSPDRHRAAPFRAPGLVGPRSTGSFTRRGLGTNHRRGHVEDDTVRGHPAAGRARDGSIRRSRKRRASTARARRRFFTITLPLLTPALVVAAAFRMLDALRLFDLAYVITGGGPGTATEPLSLYAFIALMQRLRFGYGSRCR